jgi:hypothetical protein
MREQDGPAVADPFVEIDRALRSFGGKIGCFVVDAQHRFSPGLVHFGTGRNGHIAPITLKANPVPTRMSDWGLWPGHLTLLLPSTQPACLQNPPSQVEAIPKIVLVGLGCGRDIQVLEK